MAVDPEDGEVDEVQADPFDDPTAIILDTMDAPLHLDGADGDPR